MTSASLTLPDQSLRELVASQLPQSLLRTPLDYLLAEHMRLRAVCSLLRYAAEVGQIDTDCARLVTRFVKSALPLHREDEEKDLFPELLRSARSVDELGGTIRNLEADHRQMERMQAQIVEALACDPDIQNILLSPIASELLRDFSEAERRHVAVENGIVLAIARARINAKGLAEIAASMIARREALP